VARSQAPVTTVAPAASRPNVTVPPVADDDEKPAKNNGKAKGKDD
jgi:hypothetical protein